MIVSLTLVFRLLLTQLVLLSATPGRYVFAAPETPEEIAFMDNFNTLQGQYRSLIDPLMEAINTGLGIMYKYNIDQVDAKDYELPESQKGNKPYTLYVDGKPQVYSSTNKKYMREFAEDNQKLYEALNFINNGRGYHKKRPLNPPPIRGKEEIQALVSKCMEEDLKAMKDPALRNIIWDILRAGSAMRTESHNLDMMLYDKVIPNVFNSLLRIWHYDGGPDYDLSYQEIKHIVDTQDPDNTWWLKWVKEQLESNAEKYKKPKVSKQQNKNMDQGNPNTLLKLKRIYAYKMYHRFTGLLRQGVARENLRMLDNKPDATGLLRVPSWKVITHRGDADREDPRLKALANVAQSRGNPFPKFPLQVLLKDVNPKAPPAAKDHIITDLLRVSIGRPVKKKGPGHNPLQVPVKENGNPPDLETKDIEEPEGKDEDEGDRE